MFFFTSIIYKKSFFFVLFSTSDVIKVTCNNHLPSYYHPFSKSLKILKLLPKPFELYKCYSFGFWFIFFLHTYMQIYRRGWFKETKEFIVLRPPCITHTHTHTHIIPQNLNYLATHNMIPTMIENNMVW